MYIAQSLPQYTPFGHQKLRHNQFHRIHAINAWRDVFVSPRAGAKFMFQAVDLDHGLPQFDVLPTYLTCTSPDHYQAIWFNDILVEEKEWLEKQRWLTIHYSGDLSACFGSYVARIPNSFNFKRNYQTESL